MNNLQNSVDIVKKAWEGSSYYDHAEEWTHLFWHPDRPFRQFFNILDTRRCAELACGRARHAEQLLTLAKHDIELLYCLDVLPSNIDAAKNRLKDFKQVICFVNSGFDFNPIENATLTSVFCYDAMVHFSPDLVEAYLRDTARVLKPKGKALFHHSNLDAPETGSSGKPYAHNPHARNHMTFKLFQSFCGKAKLRVIDSIEMSWGGVTNLDRLTLCEHL